MRLLTVMLLALTGCGPSTLGGPCAGDASCAKEMVCSSTFHASGPACTLPCAPNGQGQTYCEAAVGPGSGCEKYFGPDSGGYACSKPD